MSASLLPDLGHPVARPDVVGRELLDLLQVRSRRGQVVDRKACWAAAKWWTRGSRSARRKPAGAARLVDPVRSPADRAVPLQRGAAVPASGRARPPRHRAQLGHSRAVAAAEALVGAVGRRSRARCGRRHAPRGRLPRAPPSRSRAATPSLPAGPADQPVGPLGADPQRGGLVDRAPRACPGRAGSAPGGRTRSRRRTSPRPRAPASGRTAPGPWREVRCDWACEMTSSQAVFSAVTWAFFIHRWRSSSARAAITEAGASRNRPERVVEVAAAQVLEGAADLPPGGRIEDVRAGARHPRSSRRSPRRASVRTGDQPRQPVEHVLVQAQPGRLVAEQRRGPCAQPPLGGPQPDPPLQLVELPLPLGDLRRGQLGVVGRAGLRRRSGGPAAGPGISSR